AARGDGDARRRRGARRLGLRVQRPPRSGAAHSLRGLARAGAGPQRRVRLTHVRDARRRTPMATVNAADLIKNDQAHLIHPLHHASEAAEPLVVVEGRGAMIKDIQGHEYIDGLSGLWNVSVGHGREELARAAYEQLKTLAYYSNYVGSSNIPAVELATKLVSLGYRNMSAVYFTCGGAEANESAFKTARFYWKAKGKPGKIKVIARQNAYHGVTLQAMSATGMAPYWKMFEPRVPGFLHIQAPYPYRYQGAKPGETVGQAAARELEEASLRAGPDTVAAFLGEPVIGGGRGEWGGAGGAGPGTTPPPGSASSAPATRCSSSGTRSSPASAAPGSGSR